MRLNLHSNCVAIESSLLVGEEEKAYVMGEGSAPEVQRRDILCFQGSFSRLMAFSKVLGLPMDGYEEEILGPLEKLELRIKGKIVRQGTKKAKVSGSKLERRLRKLERSVSFKTNSRCGRGRGIIYRDLVRVSQ